MANAIVNRVKLHIAHGFHNVLLAATNETAQFWSYSHTLAHCEVCCGEHILLPLSLPYWCYSSCPIQINCFKLFPVFHCSYTSLKQFTALVTITLHFISYVRSESWHELFHNTIFSHCLWSSACYPFLFLAHLSFP